MTLQSGGQISFSDINNEMGIGSNYSSSLGFLNDNIRPNERPGTPSMDAFFGKSWFQRNIDGNCDNGNCSTNCNCGNINCNNCTIAGGVNCSNCDQQPFLQSNCNCACAYNCNTNTVSYACNCACTVCACYCGACGY